MSDFSSEYGLTTSGGTYKNQRRWVTIVKCVAVIAVAFTVGLIIGFFVWNKSGVYLGNEVPEKIIKDGEPDIRDKILNEIKAENIGKYLQKYTTFPHIGGKKGEEELADMVAEEWTKQGLDRVVRSSYEVLLSYPNLADLNRVDLLNASGSVAYTCQIKEANLTSDQNHPDIVPPFNAYSAPGDVTGELVYVNYGRIEDFEELERMGISVKDKIVIVRYGKIFRGDKVKFADEREALGILIFSDPADYTDPSGEVYPDGKYMPPTGVQRGTVFPDDGDPLTPGYPSIKSAFRLQQNETRLPTIPAQPICYKDAEQLLKSMDGDVAPPSWQGSIQGVTYKLQGTSLKVRMHISTTNQMANTTNVFGIIRGSVEPDRYVLLGNHRDAWVFGAVDPTSGTATMMEVSRAFGLMLKRGWRPRRTIVFCSWGAEEYGLVGSMEWVEHYVRTLAERSVAYLNVDLTIEGMDSVRAKGVPLLYDVLYDVAKLIDSPNSKNGETLYEEWMRHFPDDVTKRPIIKGLGGGSDYKGFMEFVGVPGVDVRYTFGKDFKLSSYPLYHSSYETFRLVNLFMDPGFFLSEAIGKFWAEMARYLSDSLKLPMRASTYAESLSQMMAEFKEGYENLMNAEGITLDEMEEMVKNFEKEARDFDARFKEANELNPIEIRSYNDQIMLLDRAFMDPEGLPERPETKHVLFASSNHNSYAGATFPGLVDLMYGIENSTDKINQWTKVRKHLATVTFLIDSATASLRDTDQTFIG